jgi:hypothetical protein
VPWANQRSLSWELFVAPSFSLRLLYSASPGAGLVLPLHRQYLRSPLSFPTTILFAAPALWLLGRCRPSPQLSNCSPDRLAELGISTLSSKDLEIQHPPVFDTTPGYLLPEPAPQHFYCSLGLENIIRASRCRHRTHHETIRSESMAA